MNNKNSLGWVSNIFFFLFIIIGIFLIFLAVYSSIDDFKFNKEAIEVKALVTYISDGYCSDIDCSSIMYKAYGDYEYGGNEYRDAYLLDFEVLDLEVGDSIMILCNPNNPQDISYGKKVYAGSIIMFVLGLLCIVGPVIIIKFNSFSKKNPKLK